MAKKKTTTTAKELYDLCQETINEYGTRDRDLENLEDYYFLDQDKENTQPEAEGVEVVHLPYGTNIVDLVQDLLTGTEINVTVPALSKNKADKELADTAEEFVQAALRQSERIQRQNLLARAAWLASMRGCLAGRVLGMESWLEKAEGPEGGFQPGKRIPLMIQVRDPLYVFPAFCTDGLAYVVEKRKRKVRDVRHSYGEDFLPESKLTDEVEWIEYWDADRFCYWANGEVVEKNGKEGPWPNLYGGLPYCFEFARQTGRMEPEKRARPLLKGAESVIDRMDLLDSAEATFIMKYNGDVLMVYGTEDPEIDLASGSTNYLDPDTKVEWLHAGRQSIETQIAYNKYSAQLEKASFPASLYGIDPGRVMAGYAINLLNQSGQTRLAAIVDCVERFFSSLFENCLMVAENYLADLLGGAVPFYLFSETEDDTGQKYASRRQEKLAAREFKGFYHVTVTLGEVMAPDEQANVVLATRAREPGSDGRPLLSWETVVDKWKLVSSPSEERDRIDAEMAWNEPEVVALRRALYAARIKEELAEDLRKLNINPDLVLAEARGEMGPEEGAPPEGLPPEVMPPAAQGQLLPQPIGAMEEEPMGPPPPGIEGVW